MLGFVGPLGRGHQPCDRLLPMGDTPAVRDTRDQKADQGVVR